jgi:hypothetical protein
MIEIDRDKINDIVNLAFKDSFDDVDIYHTRPENTKPDGPVLVIDGTKSGRTYSFKYTHQQVSELYTAGTLNRELEQSRDRALKETYE